MDGQEPQNTSGGASAAGVGPDHGYHRTAAVARPRSGRAQLVELALAGRIAPDGDRIAVVAPRPTGRSNTGLRVGVAAKAWRSRTGGQLDWRAPPGAAPDLPLASGAMRHGACRGGPDVRVLPTTRYQATDTAISREIEARLDSAIRTGVPPDPRRAALAALAHAVGLGKHLYPGNEGRSSRSRLRDLIRHDPMGGLVAHAVMDVQNGAAAQPRRAPGPGRPPGRRTGSHGLPRNPPAVFRRNRARIHGACGGPPSRTHRSNAQQQREQYRTAAPPSPPGPVTGAAGPRGAAGPTVRPARPDGGIGPAAPRGHVRVAPRTGVYAAHIDRFPAVESTLVAVCSAADTQSGRYESRSRRCTSRGVQCQSHRQATPAGPGAAPAP
ncbi:GPP34 family phosphoprotein [Streptomyces thinghirensis]|nr:GPP34 family phosphoprotein [Streptomyces thinghirensis]